MNKVWKCLKRSAVWAFGFSSIIFMFVPEALFENRILPIWLIDFVAALFVFNSKEASNATETAKTVPLINVMANRVLLLIFAICIAMVAITLLNKIMCRVTIKGKNYRIDVKYGDIFKQQNCQKVINFDECFTTEVGLAPGQIKPSSVCGQYLALHPLTKQEMQDLLCREKLKPMRSRSSFQNQDRYESGVLIPREDYLLMAFAKLDSNGLGRITWDEYLCCLRLLWKQIDIHYAEKDVCIPVLGSGITRMNDKTLTQQELLDAIIESYKLSSDKINSAHRLIIACKRDEKFDLDKIGENL